MATELFASGAPDVLYIIDLSSYVLRAYHAIAPLTSASGEPTQAVHGTVNMLERLVRERRPAMLVIAMDSGRGTFRRDLYAEYKAHRPPAPADLKQQMARCEQIVTAFNIPVLKQDGVEADDLIATAAVHATKRGYRTVIVAADKDLMQLVGPEIILWDTMRDRVFGPAEVEERFGVKVAQLRDLLALMGDSSDNIPGVPHVGPKTAKELLLAHGTLEGIYENLDRIAKKSLRENLIAHREQAFLSQRLVTLKADCPIAFEPEALRYGGRDVPALKRIYAELGFHRQLQLLEADANPALPGPAPKATAELQAGPAVGEYQTLIDVPALERFAEDVRKAGRLALAVATTVPSATRGVLTGLGLSIQAGHGIYIPLVHRYVGAPKQPPLAEVQRIFAPILAEPSIQKVAHDLKHADVALARHGFRLAGHAFSAELASYLIDPEARHDRNALIQRELGIAAKTYDELTKRPRGPRLDFDELSVEDATSYAAAGADYALRLSDKLGRRLAEEGLDRLCAEIELPLSALLAELEVRGVLIDTKKLAELGARCQAELERLEAEAHRIAGRTFNVNSPRQLETLLFDEVGLKPVRRTKTSRSTDAETLESLAEQHELPRVILEIRQVAKLKGTYIDALPLLVDRHTGRIHTSWDQSVAATGRLSSSDPNLQNIPIRTELGRSIREAFVPPPGHAMVSADYSQIELRVLAHLSQDAVLLDAFRTGQDIHLRTAMEIFELPAEQVTREHRTRAKAVNFGVIYGQGDSGLAKALGISRAQAGEFIAAYFRRYEGVRRFMNETLDQARSGETVKSLLGRRRMLPNIKSANRAERLAAERIAMNMPIQGSAADILKLAMLALKDPPTPGTRMILTVHDELVFEVPLSEVEEAKREIKRAMENVYALAVPLEVDVGHGPNWNAAH
jgi:DNA polymerase-1